MIEELSEIEEVDYDSEKPILFGPRDGKTIRQLYKEIADDPIFKPLTNAQIHFAWLLGIPYSPLSDQIPESTRYRLAAAKAFVLERDLENRQRYGAFDVPGEVKEAIQKFSMFLPEARLIAQSAVQEMIHSLRALAVMDKDLWIKYIEVKDAEGVKYHVKQADFDARKKYVDTCKTINENLPEMLKTLESGGFGINDKKSDKRDPGSKPIDRFHSNKRERAV